MDFTTSGQSEPSQITELDLARLMEAGQKDLFGYLEMSPGTSEASELQQAPKNSPETIPKTRRLYQCEFCISNYIHFGTYLAHRNAHLKINVHKCDFCAKTFQNSYWLKMHIWNHWDNNGQPFPCVLKGCPRQFPTIHHLRSHLKKYHRLCYWKDHYCKVCRDKHSDPDKMLSHYYWEHVRNAPESGPVRNQLINKPSSSENAPSNLVVPGYNAISNFPASLLNNGQSTSAPTNVPAHNPIVNEPQDPSEAGPAVPLIPENNPLLTILKYLMKNMKPTDSYLSHLPEHVLQISPEKGIHWVHWSQALQIQMPEIAPELVKNLLEHFRASNS